MAETALCNAAANGDTQYVKELVQRGCDVDAHGSGGMTPLAIASFWGYADITAELLRHGADVHGANKGTQWTALHCAAFQGHGPVVLSLLRNGSDTMIPDAQGRTAADFASAIDTIWPLFEAAGCKRTPKTELVAKRIIVKQQNRPTASRMSNYSSQNSYLSRPGSAYVLATQDIYRPNVHRDSNSFYMARGGDVLANE